MKLMEVLTKLALPPREYVIVGGAVMEALGIKLTEDIDIVVSEELFASYLQSGNWILEQTPNGKQKLKRYLPEERHKKVEIYLDVNTPDFNPSFQELLARSLSIDGFSFISLSDLIHFKEAYNRPKDLKDLNLLRAAS